MFFFMFFLSAISVGIIGMLWVVHEYDRFKKESEKLRIEYIEEQKHLIKSEVIRAVDFINISINQTEIQLKKSIKSRVYEAFEIADNLYNQFHKSKSESELKRMIIEALRNIRFNNERGYYFITDFNGIEHLFADHPEWEGRNLLDMQDSQGKYLIKDMINIAKNSREGFYQYLWTKPEANGNNHAKIAFIKNFKPFNWFIGTGEYLEDVRDDIQNAVLQRLINIRFGTNGYIFGSSYDGEPLFTSGSITKGSKNVLDLTDPNGVKIIQEQRKAVRNPEGAFYRYTWKKLTSLDPSPKLSFSKGIPEWEWMIGAGVYLDEVDKIIALKKKTLDNQIRNQFIKVLLIFLILIFISYLFAKRISVKIHKIFERFLVFFDKASSSYVQIDSSNMVFSEFTRLADLANNLIEEREDSKEDLNKSKALWRSLTETSPDHILALDHDFNIQFANLAFPGLEVKDLIGKPFYQFVEGKEKQDEVKGIFERVIRTSEQQIFETVYDVPERGSIYYESSVAPRMLEDSKEIIGLTVNSRNITERKQAEESIRKLSGAVKQSPASVVITDLSGAIEYANPKFEQLTGYSLEEAVGKNPSILKSSEHTEEFYQELWNTITAGKEWTGIFHNQKKNGELYWESATIAPIKDEKGKIINYLAVKKDITEQRQAEEIIKASLEEKETLLQEVHHRVKNNMQVITSLLQLQFNNIENIQIKEALKESQSRVYAMSAVHETLHGAKNLSKIDLKNYISKITNSIFQTYSTDLQKVKLKSDIETSAISINQAYPLGLIINELISNSLKYAFPDDKKSEISVTMKKLDKELELTVVDNGVGIPADLDWKHSKSLGLKLVRTLVENQLDGSIDMDSKNGTKFTIKFNIDNT